MTFFDYPLYMLAGQVPVWVPIVVAALGIFGIVAGQLASSRREKRRWSRAVREEEQRWNRELRREQQRWERELERERERRAHEQAAEAATFEQHARLEWRSRRLDAYLGYLHAVDHFMRAFGSAYLMFFDVRAPARSEEHEADLEAIVSASVPIEFIASAPVREAAELLQQACYRLHYRARPVWFADGDRPTLDKDDIQRRIEAVTECRRKFAELIRAELAVELGEQLT